MIYILQLCIEIVEGWRYVILKKYYYTFVLANILTLVFFAMYTAIILFYFYFCSITVLMRCFFCKSPFCAIQCTLILLFACA